jgi:hypothetical protein
MRMLHEALTTPTERDMLVIWPDRPRFDPGELRISKAGEDIVWLCRPTGPESVSRRHYARLLDLARRSRLREAREVRRLLESRQSRLEDAREIDAKIDRLLAAAGLRFDDVVDLPPPTSVVWRLAESQTKEERT